MIFLFSWSQNLSQFSSNSSPYHQKWYVTHNFCNHKPSFFIDSVWISLEKRARVVSPRHEHTHKLYLWTPKNRLVWVPKLSSFRVFAGFWEERDFWKKTEKTQRGQCDCTWSDVIRRIRSSRKNEKYENQDLIWTSCNRSLNELWTYRVFVKFLLIKTIIYVSWMAFDQFCNLEHVWTLRFQ